MNILVAGAASWTENYATVSEKLFIGVTMALIGIVIVVMILALISIVVSLISRIVNRDSHSSDSGKTRKRNEPAPAKAADRSSVKTSAAARVTNDSFDHIAVLTAAIAAYRSDTSHDGQHSTAGFLVRRIRRV